MARKKKKKIRGSFRIFFDSACPPPSRMYGCMDVCVDFEILARSLFTFYFFLLFLPFFSLPVLAFNVASCLVLRIPISKTAARLASCIGN